MARTEPLDNRDYEGTLDRLFCGRGTSILFPANSLDFVIEGYLRGKRVVVDGGKFLCI